MEEFLKLIDFSPSPGFSIIMASIIVPTLLYFKGVPKQLWDQVMRMITITLIVDETDNMAGEDTFQALNKWICENRIQWLTRVFEINKDRQIVAGIGFNIFTYKGSYFWCYMGRKDPANSFHKIKSIGTYNLFTFKWNKALLEELVESSCKPHDPIFEAAMYRCQGDEARYVTRFPSYMKAQKQLLSKETYKEISEIFERFVNNPDSYFEKEKPHKETILLYGPPGTGKTNLIRHLAAKYNLDLVSVKPEDVTLSTFTVRSWKSEYYDNAYTLYLVEDIDSNKALLQGHSPDQTIVVNSGDSDMDKVKGTLSEMLNALDGAVPLDRCIVVLTTNHVDKLEKAIYRAGRVDHHINMDYVKFEDAVEYLQWSESDPRYEVLKQGCVKLHAITVSKMPHAKTVEEVQTLLQGGELSTTIGLS